MRKTIFDLIGNLVFCIKNNIQKREKEILIAISKFETFLFKISDFILLFSYLASYKIKHDTKDPIKF